MYLERFRVSLSQGKFCRYLFWIQCNSVLLLMTWMVEDSILNYTYRSYHLEGLSILKNRIRIQNTPDKLEKNSWNNRIWQRLLQGTVFSAEVQLFKYRMVVWDKFHRKNLGIIVVTCWKWINDIMLVHKKTNTLLGCINRNAAGQGIDRILLLYLLIGKP